MAITIGEAPPEPPGILSKPSRSRWRRWVFGGLAVLMATLLIAAVVFVSTYDPICHGTSGCTGIGGANGPTMKNLGQFTSPTGENFSAFSLDHHPGDTFRLFFTLSDQGPFGITITRIGWTNPTYSPYFSVARVGANRERGTATFPPFHPFSLSGHGGEYIDVAVTVRLRGCLVDGGGTSISDIPITYRFLGFTHHTTVYLPETIQITGTARHCP